MIISLLSYSCTPLLRIVTVRSVGFVTAYIPVVFDRLYNYWSCAHLFSSVDTAIGDWSRYKSVPTVT